MRRADFNDFKLIAWVLAFYACANFSALLENVYRYGAALTSEQILFTGAEKLASVNTSINLLNEPIFSYLSLALTGFCAVMGARQLIKFSNYYCSLVHGEKPFSRGVNV